MAKSDYYKCDCGGIFKQYNKHIHINKKNKRHTDYVNNVNPNPQFQKIKMNVVSCD
jgi:hypothetical protein